jgi:hypothetical protein
VLASGPVERIIRAQIGDGVFSVRFASIVNAI